MMSTSEQYNIMLLMSSVSLATVSRMLPDGSTFMDVVQGVLTGVAIVGMLAGLWMYGKARKSKV
ncbi:hypothetical protein [Paenibacillus sp. FSL E2-0190]|uniref:hypothetical protein n=1 Tax=Paenibacillus sp. FSL E2-0190 TaxID=2954504 RepID=UPI0030ED8081